MTGNGMTAVERAELHTTDMDLLAGMVRQQYAGHAATFRCADPAMVDGQLRTATAGGLTVGMLGYDGFEYTAHLDPVLAPTTVTVLRGSGSITAGRQEQRFTAGDVTLLPADRPALGQTVTGIRYATLQVPWAAVRALAEEGAAVSAESLRFDSTAPLSAARQRAYASTAAFICEQLLTSGTTQVHPILAQSMTGLAAAAMLETFPNTTMTAPHRPGPGWVTPASVRQAAEFIRAHAGESVTVADIAAEGRPDAPGAALRVPPPLPRHRRSVPAAGPAGKRPPATAQRRPRRGRDRRRRRPQVGMGQPVPVHRRLPAAVPRTAEPDAARVTGPRADLRCAVSGLHPMVSNFTACS